MDSGTRTELARYMREVCKYTVLERDQELELAHKAKTGDLKAREILINSNLRFVVQVANQFKAYTKPGKYTILDLIQEGNSGLVHAYSKFDPDSGYRFTTYAVHWIRARIMSFIIRMHSMVKLGTTAAERKLFFKMGKIKSLFEERDSAIREENRLDLAKELETTSEVIKQMEDRFHWNDTSIDKPMGSSDESDDRPFSIKDILMSPSVEDEIEARLFHEKMHEAIERAMASLSDREQDVIRMRWLEDEDGATLQEIADKYQLSRERIRQIEAKVFQEIKEYLEDDEIGREIVKQFK